jgi:hypothetical protein
LALAGCLIAPAMAVRAQPTGSNRWSVGARATFTSTERGDSGDRLTSLDVRDPEFEIGLRLTPRATLNIPLRLDLLKVEQSATRLMVQAGTRLDVHLGAPDALRPFAGAGAGLTHLRAGGADLTLYNLNARIGLTVPVSTNMTLEPFAELRHRLEDESSGVPAEDAVIGGITMRWHLRSPSDELPAIPVWQLTSGVDAGVEMLGGLPGDESLTTFRVGSVTPSVGAYVSAGSRLQVGTAVAFRNRSLADDAERYLALQPGIRLYTSHRPLAEPSTLISLRANIEQVRVEDAGLARTTTRLGGGIDLLRSVPVRGRITSLMGLGVDYFPEQDGDPSLATVLLRFGLQYAGGRAPR